MTYMFCYKLIRTLCYVVGDRLQESTHRFLVVERNAAIALNQNFFIVTQCTSTLRRPGSGDDVEDIKTHSVQGLQIASIRATLIALIAALGVSGYSPNLGHFFLFKAQSDPFFAQAIASAQLREPYR